MKWIKDEHDYYKGEHKVRPYGLCVIEWFVLGIGGRGLYRAQKCRGNPCDFPDVDETIRELSVRAEA